MDPTSPTQACCGEDGTWSPKPGNPIIAACMLCPQSPTYWQRGRTEPYVAARLRNDADPVKRAARLTAIAADPDWPDDLRAEAHAAAEDGLEVDDLTDSTIITALNTRIVSRAGGARAGGLPNTVSGRRQP